MGVHDDHRASRNRQHFYLQRFPSDGVELSSTPLLLDCIVRMRVWTIKKPAPAVIPEKVGTTDNLERAIMLLKAIHIDCNRV